MYYIYKLTDCNGLTYYGSSENVDERFKGHMKSNNKCSSNKLDRLSMKVEVIETLPEDSTENDARWRERWYFDNKECVNEDRPIVTDEERIQHLKEYHRDYYEKNTDIIKERMKEYYEKNVDIINVKSKEYYEKNADIIKERNKEYYEKNTDIIKERVKEYYEKNVDIIKEKQKEYYEKNADIIKEKRKERYVQKKELNLMSQEDKY